MPSFFFRLFSSPSKAPAGREETPRLSPEARSLAESSDDLAEVDGEDRIDRVVDAWSARTGDSEVSASSFSETDAAHEAATPSPSPPATPQRGPRTLEPARTPDAEARTPALSVEKAAAAHTPSELRTPPRNCNLGLWLAARGLGKYEAALVELGVKKIADLAYLDDDDFEALGVTIDERRELTIVRAT